MRAGIFSCGRLWPAPIPPARPVPRPICTALTRMSLGGLPVALASATAASHCASNSSNAASARCSGSSGRWSTSHSPRRAAGTILHV